MYCFEDSTMRYWQKAAQVERDVQMEDMTGWWSMEEDEANQYYTCQGICHGWQAEGEHKEEKCRRKEEEHRMQNMSLIITIHKPLVVDQPKRKATRGEVHMDEDQEPRHH
jgi:hypothetical protein